MLDIWKLTAFHKENIITMGIEGLKIGIVEESAEGDD